MASVEPMMLGSTVSRSARFGWKVPAFLCLSVGASCIILWSQGYGQQVAVADESITMALSRYGVGSSPVERVAIAAIEASGRSNCGRDVSVKAATLSEIEKIKADDPFFKKLAKVTRSVKSKAATLSVESSEMPGLTTLELKELPGAGITGKWRAFDPIGLSTMVSEDQLLFYREAELKHGRICMLASLGIVVAEKYHPLFGDFFAGPAALAIQKTPVEYQYFWWAILALISVPEITNAKSLNLVERRVTDDSYTPGDWGFDPLGINPLNNYKPATERTEKFREMQTKELNNGRLAMIAAAGMLAQEMVTGKTIF